MLPAIVITPGEFARGEPVFAAAQDVRFVVAGATSEEAVCAAVLASGAHIACVGHQPRYSTALFAALASPASPAPPSPAAAAAPWLGLVTRFGVGHENVDKAAAAAARVLAANTPGTLDDSVAEHALWLMGAHAKHLAVSAALLRGGGWAGAPAGRELRGRTLGIVGLGAIGRTLAAAAARGLGMRVIAAGTSAPAALAAREGRPLPELLAALGVASYTDDVDALFAEADFISLHLPSTPRTRHFVDARRLALMRPGAVLVNTARGAVVDEAALYDAVAAGRIGGAALDVFEAEPYAPAAPGKDLRTLPAVLMTPHIGSHTAESNANMARGVLRNARAFLAGDFAAVARVHAEPE